MIIAGQPTPPKNKAPGYDGVRLGFGGGRLTSHDMIILNTKI